MKYKLLPFCIAVLLVVFAGGCKKESTPSVNVNVLDADIYLSGGIWIGSNYTAGYWKDGNYISLSGTINSWAKAIAVSGKDIYIVGVEGSSTNGYGSFGVYWKNGVETPLSYYGTNVSAVANAVAISGNDVYVAGEAGGLQSSSPTIACYWKNGVYIPLSDSGQTNYAGATAIAISGSDIYISGTATNNIPGYWKNGIFNALPIDALEGIWHVTGIAVAGNDVYVSAYLETTTVEEGDRDFAYYWKNGIRKALPDPSVSDPGADVFAQSIAVAGSDVYIGGSIWYEESGVPVQYSTIYWKNGEFAGLVDSGVGSTTSCYLTLSGNDIYQASNGENANSDELLLCGKLGSTPAQIVSPAGSQSQVTGIAVVKK